MNLNKVGLFDLIENSNIVIANTPDNVTYITEKGIPLSKLYNSKVTFICIDRNLELISTGAIKWNTVLSVLDKTIKPREYSVEELQNNSSIYVLNNLDNRRKLNTRKVKNLFLHIDEGVVQTTLELPVGGKIGTLIGTDYDKPYK